MSLLAAGRHFGSALKMYALGKQLRAISTLHQCDFDSKSVGVCQLLSVQKPSSGIRYHSYQAYTDFEDMEKHARKTQGSRNSKHKSTKFQKKLHSRVFSEQEIADNQQFRSQSFVHENESDADMFGTFQKRRESRKACEHSSTSALFSSFQNDTFHSSVTADGKSARSENNFSEHSASKEKTNKTFLQKGARPKQSRSWGDEFGTLNEDNFAERIEESRSTAVGSHEERFSGGEDEEDRKRIPLSAVGRRRIPEWYGRRILKLGKRGQIREAIEVLEDWMLKKDRVMPNSYVFTCLLTVLGRAGYTKKAFSLFRKMKSMGIQPKPATYTALFNACANSPWKEDGLARADSLFQLMKEKEVDPTFITGKSMVKAFAMCGDLRRAFSLVDELSKVYRPDPEIFSFLLMACISDKEAGLRHAIQVWRVMQHMNVQPDLPLYNLLLRCVRDCGVGDPSSFTSLLTGGAAASQLEARSTQQSTLLPSHTKTDSGDVLDLKEVEQVAEFNSASIGQEQVSPESVALNIERDDQQSKDPFRNLETGKQTQVISQQDVQSIHSLSTFSLHSSVTIPDVLSPNHHDSRIVSVGDLSTKENRLLLLGGVEGILSRMAKDGATPDVITFTQLISVARPTVEAEEQLLDTMRSMRVKPDIDLINTLIHKRCMRADFAAARAVGEIILEHGLTCNQMTYGVLAMTCRSQQDAAQLLEDMEAADMAPNMEILGTLMYASYMKFGYKLWVLRQAQRLNLPPNAKFLHNVENSLAMVRRKMVHAEKQGQTDNPLLSPSFEQSVKTFTQHYESWLKETQVQRPRHPWANFKPSSTDHKDALSV